MGRKRKSLCVYCGVRLADTRDHIPPKALFAKPRPSNLITVPSCLACNGSAALDDEYFLFATSSRFDVGDHPDAAEANRSVLRGLALPKKSGLKNLILNITREVQARTSAGIHLGTVGVYDVDLVRLSKVPERNIIGLYYHHFRRPLDRGFRVFAWAWDGIDTELFRVDRSAGRIVSAMLEQPVHRAGEVLCYRYCILPDNQSMSAWLLTYYKCVHFLGITVPEKSANPTGHAGDGYRRP